MGVSRVHTRYLVQVDWEAVPSAVSIGAITQQQLRSEAEIRLWPMPDLDRPAFHTLPHGELLRRLHDLTNLRVVEDTDASTGWKVEIGPFPGWEEVPTW